MKTSSQTRDPYPVTWEIPLLIGLLWLVAAGVAIHLARGVANLAAGSGFAWPESGQWIRSLPGVLSGDASAGMSAPAGAVASPTLVITAVIITQVLLMAAIVWAGLLIHLRWGGGQVRGMASRSEADQLLGLRRLRKNKAVIRPDLYGRRTEP